MKPITIKIIYHFRHITTNSLKLSNEWMAQQDLRDAAGYLACYAIVRKDRLSWWSYHLHKK